MYRTIISLALVALAFSNAAACTTYGHGNSVCGDFASKIPYGSQWVYDGDGISYMPWNYDPHHIMWAGDSQIELKFAVPKGSQYYFTVESYAPHSTEFNDCYVKSSCGFNMRYYWNSGHEQYAGHHWMKAYQNEGWSQKIATVDHHPHAFVTPYLQEGSHHSIYVSGRSTRFKLKKWYLCACEGSECSPYSDTVKNCLSSAGMNSCY